jgi:Zn-finger nucleic acid-binding protein
MAEDNLCPECKVELTRKLGLPGIVSDCPQCHKRFVRCLDKLVSLEEFHERVAAEQ